MILGTDDTARCIALGDLVIAGVLLESENDLDGLDVRDSKEMTETQRLRAFPEIFKRAKGVFVEFITPKQIAENNLNDLEAQATRNIYRRAVKASGGADLKVFVDLWECNKEKFMWRMENNGVGRDITKKWIAEHNGDKKFKVVSAASVVAKVISDMQLARYRHLYDCGSGQPSDKKTIGFLETHLDCNESCEACKMIRKSWITYKRLKEAKQ